MQFTDKTSLHHSLTRHKIRWKQNCTVIFENSDAQNVSANAPSLCLTCCGRSARHYSLNMRTGSAATFFLAAGFLPVGFLPAGLAGLLPAAAGLAAGLVPAAAGLV